MRDNIAVYPGSFDPCTNGHIDIIERASKVFERLVVGVLYNSNKTATFSVEQRVDFLRRVTAEYPNVEIASFDGLLVDFVKKIRANVILKGLRAMSDFEYEFQMALANKTLCEDVETLFMTTSSGNSFLSSSVVKEIALHGGKISHFVPSLIEQDILRKFNRLEEV